MVWFAASPSGDVRSLLCGTSRQGSGNIEVHLIAQSCPGEPPAPLHVRLQLHMPTPCRPCPGAGSYRADWEPAATSGRRVLGVFWRCPAVLWGPSTPNPTQVSWKTLILKNWPIFPASCGYVVVLPHVAQVRFWRPKMPHSE